MKARILAFKWEINPIIDFDTFFTHLKTYEQQQQHEIAQHIASETCELLFSDPEKCLIFAITRENQIWSGLLLRIRDASSFCKLIAQQNVLHLGTQSLSPSELMVEVNFFVFDQHAQKGLYLYYHHSTWINKFNSFFKKRYNDLIKNKREEYDHAVEDGVLTKQECKHQKSLLKTLATDIICKQDNFETLIRELSSINTVSYTFQTNGVRAENALPLCEYSSRASVDIRIKTQREDDLKREIISFASRITRGLITSIKVTGKKASTMEQAEDVIVKFEKNYNFFGSKEYEELFGSLNLDLQNIPASLTHEIFSWLNQTLTRELRSGL